MHIDHAENKSPDYLAEHFASWIDPTCQLKFPTVLVGAGMSHALVPMAHELAAVVKAKKIEIEQELGVICTTSPDSAKLLYDWASECLKQLYARGIVKRSAKKMLADAMGITTNERFHAKTHLLLRGTTDRHRVLGRLSREGHINAIWSFNWDCWLESAFKAVGLQAGDLNSIEAPDQWRTCYSVWFEGKSSPKYRHTLSLFKAHGCVVGIEDGLSDFVISSDEMAEDYPQPPARIMRMEKDLQDTPVVCIGWGATEPYIRKLIKKLATNSLLSDALTIADVQLDQNGHLEIQDAFGVSTTEAGVLLNRESPGNADDLFLWIQAKRGVACIEQACKTFADLESKITALDTRIPDFRDSALSSSWVVSFLDNWLPIWLRTCFMVKAQEHKPAIAKSLRILPTQERDAHIPWTPISYTRHDLLSAANLIVALDGHVDMKAWDFSKFPGALWCSRTQALILPVPAWAEERDITIFSLKSLVESVHWQDRARIKSCAVLMLNSPAVVASDKASKDAIAVTWTEALAGLFASKHLAVPKSMRVIELADLAEVAGE